MGRSLFFKKKVKKKKYFFKISFLVLLTILIFYILSLKISISGSIKIIFESNYSYLFLSFITLFTVMILLIVRWLFIIKTISVKFTFKDAMISLMASLPLNSILPSKLGDFFKAFYFKSAGITKILGSIFTERLFDLITLVILFLFASIFLKNIVLIIVALVAFLFLLILTLVLLLLSDTRLFKKYTLLQNLLYSIYWIISRPKKTLILLFWSFSCWFFSLLQIYFLFLALSIHVELIYFVYAIILSIFISMIPITIAGMGTRETAIIILFSALASKEALLAAGLLFSFSRYILLAIAGLPFLVYFILKERS